MDAPPLHLHLHTPCCSDHHRMLVTFHPTFSSFSRTTTTCICLARKRPWDSNAESFLKRKFDFRYGGDDEEDEIDESWVDQGSSFFDKAIQNIFIFKVLKSYGWMLPFIIISLLLVSGPKVFLLTLGLAVALSLIAYAFQNLFAEIQSSPGRIFTSKKRSSTATWRSSVYAKSDKGTQTRKGSTVSRATRNDDSVGKSVQDNPYGGWDELDEIVDYPPEQTVKMPDQTKVDSNGAVDSQSQPVKKKKKIPDQTRVPSELNRMNRRRREISRTPLLLRLLIAAFPFLNSWIKLL